MNIHEGRIGLTRDDLPALEARGFVIHEHTPYYMNGITATFRDLTVGLYCYLDGLDAYMGENKVIINNQEQADAFFAIMDGIVQLNKLQAQIGMG